MSSERDQHPPEQSGEEEDALPDSEIMTVARALAQYIFQQEQEERRRQELLKVKR